MAGCAIPRFWACGFLCSLFALFPVIGLAEEPATEPDYVELPITSEDREHWAFLPRLKVDLSGHPRHPWAVNEIDNLVYRELERAELMPQPAATKRDLIRRLSYDLTGLPPTAEEIKAFLADPHPAAYQRLVDRLLGSPRYGERWAQHWLDLARFAETDGFEHDKVRGKAWKYRDWVVSALNADMPYDEFLTLQLAGDEISPDDDSAVTATRFCLSGPDMPDINLTEERMHTVLNEMVSTVGEVILGLQVGCAQCHDHKFDSISQADFYRLRAIFRPAVRLKKNVSLSVFQEDPAFAKPSHLMLRGDFRRPGPEVQPGVLRVIAEDPSDFQPTVTNKSKGLRTELAKWLVDSRNPLTSRVIVNRVWQYHFGQGIVTTPSDFGVTGEYPSHDELLDWLADYLIEQDWSLKALHKKIVTSATYRQRSFLPADRSDVELATWQRSLERDPSGALLSRYTRWRLEGEAIRDAMLFSAGGLSFDTGGPGVRPPLPQELLETLLKKQWDVTEDVGEHQRRSLYVFARRNLRYPIFEVFDRPSANVSCPQRGKSTTAPQSLHLLNSSFSFEIANQLAASIAAEQKEPREQIAVAFQRILGRQPTPADYDDVDLFWNQHHPLAGNDPGLPLVHLCLALFNCNEFVFVD